MSLYYSLVFATLVLHVGICRQFICKEIDDVFSADVCRQVGPQRVQGAAGKRGQKGNAGLRGPVGPPGPKEPVDYNRINAYIASQVEDVLTNMSSQLLEMKTKMQVVERIARVGSAKCEVTYDNMCFFSVVRSDDVNFDAAEKICEDRDSNVADVRSRRHYDLMMANLRKKTPSGRSTVFVWTGLRINPMDGSVTLGGGAAAPFTKWRSASFPQIGSSYSTEYHIYLNVNSDPEQSDQGMGNDPRTGNKRGVICQI